MDRKTLADQWRARIAEFLGVKAGQLGGSRAKLRGSIDVVTLQTLSRRDDVAELTAGYGLIVADECHHVPATAFEHAVKQIPARRWLGLTATPCRRDKLDDLVAMQVGPVRHIIALSRDAPGQDTLPGTGGLTPYVGEGFDCPALDTLFLAAPVANRGSLTQYVGWILRTHENKTTAEVHDYLDEQTGVLAAMLAKRAPGYTGLGFSDPRRLALTPSARTDGQPTPQAQKILQRCDIMLMYC